MGYNIIPAILIILEGFWWLHMMIYISIGLCVVGFITFSTAMAFIIATGFFGDSEEKES
jgi:hypothetical protein